MIAIRLSILSVCLWLFVGTMAWSAPQADILIVVDTRIPAQVTLERDLRQIFKTGREQRGLSSEVLPIDTYDLRKEGHRVALQRLHIAAGSVPFLALGQLDDQGRPLKVLAGVAQVQNAQDGISRLNTRFQALAKQALSASPVCGTWKQYVDVHGEQVWLLTVQVAQVGEEYHYTLEDVSPRSNVQRIHIFNTLVQGPAWSFDSDWGKAGTAHFVLHAETADRYVGYSYLNGQRHESQTWVRVQR